MPCNTQNVKIGACDIYIDGVNLGLTKGGVVVSISTETKTANDNHFGDILSEELVVGREITVKVPIAETTLENIQKALPATSLTVNSTKERLDIYENKGTKLRNAFSVELQLRPIHAASANEYFTIPIAISLGVTSLTYESKKQRVMEVEFRAYEDVNGKLAYFGDITA